MWVVFGLGIMMMTACGAVTFQPRPAMTIVAETITPIRTATSSLIIERPIRATPTPTVGLKPTVTFTPLPTASTLIEPTFTPSPPITPESALKVYRTTITLPTYPFRDYLVEQIDPAYNMPVFYFDRAAFEVAAPTPTPVDYTGVVLENAYLRLTFLPELGGRLYSAIVKRTGQEIFYHNKVVKPSRYGILQPSEANWWLATGGMEWAYPTQEHGYRWGVPWAYEVTQTAGQATITLSDLAPDRVGVSVQVTLLADSALFIVTPRLVNTGSMAAPIQFWTNAALSLSSGTMSSQTRFVIPVEEITIHSRGAEGWTISDAHSQAPWPIVDSTGATDLRDYTQWASYLGFFIPNMAAPFMGAYNPEANLGVARLIEPGTVPGNKLFAFSASFPYRDYTDDDSQYFEIWGGANTGFWPENDIAVPPGGELRWQERWWPLAGLGGLTWANDRAAIHLVQSGDTYSLSALVSRPTQGTLTILAGETPILTESFWATPAEVQQWPFSISMPDGPVQVRLVDRTGSVLLAYQEND